MNDTEEDYHSYNTNYDRYYQMYHDDFYEGDDREFIRRCLERPDATLITKHKKFAATFAPFGWEKQRWLSPGASEHHRSAMWIEEKFGLHNTGQCGFLIDPHRRIYLFVADEGVFMCSCSDDELLVALCVAKSIDDAVKVLNREIPPEGTIIDIECPEVTSLKHAYADYPFFGFST
jgi:hypothetical protein